MTPREALNLLDQAAANFQGNRQDHINLQGAIAVLNGLVLKSEAETRGVEEKVEEAAIKTVATKGKKEAPEE